ncbi:nuclear transport factor 2 family protein [Mucilaginibacter sp. HC2]|uniref:nuclear transport factor 2 family protein n=1 Tax=Mucilaginibacter inviolabilis TaxID=2714892 RepID=UPI00140E34D7|nr:nuclear transport factor 2 family protein [Mucilaginibacter inviolabilis]NHA03428.1 nuclear transport factor 2 family protein [Mucilaginibacter inviolabilis]
MPAIKNNNSIADYDNIIAVAKIYVDGLKTGNVDQLKQTFHSEGLMAGYMPDGQLTTKLQFLYDFTQENGAAADVKAHISILHKTETAAVVLVELEDLQGGVGSTDYLSLLLIDGEWKVLSKVFNLYWGQ